MKASSPPVTRRIIGAAFGDSGPGRVTVILEGRDSYGYAQVDHDGRVEPEQGSFFPKDGLYGHDPRRFLAILGKFAPEVQELYKFIPFAGEWSINQADAESLFRWDRETQSNEMLKRNQP